MCRCGPGDVVGVVGGEADGGAVGVQLAEHLHQRVAALRIEVARRLVGEQDRRASGDRARDGDELLVTAGQLSGPLLRSRGESDAVQGRSDAFLAFLGGRPAQRERILDVLLDRHVADQVEALKDEPDLDVAHAGALGRAAADRPRGR